MGARNETVFHSNKQSLFVSRGDKSGTHITEMELWKEGGLAVPDKDAWYISAGQGMLATIQTLQFYLTSQLHNPARRDSKIIHGAFGVSG
jgi:ABC-type tungstate transport system permease subunit